MGCPLNPVRPALTPRFRMTLMLCAPTSIKSSVTRDVVVVEIDRNRLLPCIGVSLFALRLRRSSGEAAEGNSVLAPAPSKGGSSPTREGQKHNDHRPEVIKIHYPWHPLHRQSLRVRRRRRFRGESTLLRVADGTIGVGCQCHEECRLCHWGSSDLGCSTRGTSHLAR